METTHELIIIGAGLSGLSTAHFLLRMNPDLELLLLEKDSRPGGAVQSFQDKGFLAEWGPHGFLDNTPESQEILKDTGLDQICQKAPLGNFVRYLCHNGALVALPQNPKKLLSTPLLSFGGKLRLLADLWKKPKHEDQTIGDWAAYRFGKAVAPLVDAAVTGTFAGDYERLSIDAVMPGVRQLEKEHGSVLRGLIKKKKNSAGPRRLPAMTSFPQGMEQLIKVLAESKNIRFDNAAHALTHSDDVWQIETNKETFRTKNLILALPVNQGLKLLAPFSPPASSIPVARINTVVLGFTDTAKVPFGFGYLAPEKENRFTLGALFSTHMFPGRAPQGNILLEALVGGRRHPERLDLDDHTLVEQVYNDLSQILELPEPPCYSKVLRSRSGIPQLEMGHPALLKWRAALEREKQGLSICGFGWDGIGMNEMIKAAKKVAEQASSGIRSQPAEAKVKPVYF